MREVGVGREIVGYRGCCYGSKYSKYRSPGRQHSDSMAQVSWLPRSSVSPTRAIIYGASGTLIRCTTLVYKECVSSTLGAIVNGRAGGVAVAPWLTPVAHVEEALSRSTGQGAWLCFMPRACDDESKPAVLSYVQPHCQQHVTLPPDRAQHSHHALEVHNQ